MNADDLVPLHLEEKFPLWKPERKCMIPIRMWLGKHIKFLEVVHCQKYEGKGWYALSSFSAEMLTNGNNSCNSWKSGNLK